MLYRIAFYQEIVVNNVYLPRIAFSSKFSSNLWQECHTNQTVHSNLQSEKVHRVTIIKPIQQ